MRIAACPLKPNTPKRPQSETIFGQEVHDDYRWLENPTDEREAWIEQQKARTDCELDSYPHHQEIKDRLTALFQAGNAAYNGPIEKGPGYSMQWVREQGAQHSRLTRISADGQASEVVFDPDSWPKGETLAWARVSPDRQYLAYARALNGKDSGRLEVLDIGTGEVVRTLDGAKTTQAATWAQHDDKLYMSMKDGVPGFVSYDVSDNEIKQKSAHWMAPYGEVAEHDGTVVFTTNSPAYLQENVVLLKKDGTEAIAPISTGRMSFSSKGANLFIQTTADAPDGKVLVTDLAQAESEGLAGKVLIPEKPGRRISQIQAVKDGVAVSYTDNYMPGLALYDLDGKVVKQVDFQEPGVVSNLRTDDAGNLKFDWSTLVQPTATKKLDLETGEVSTLKEAKLPGFNPDDYTVERKWFTSADGTRVPMTLAHKKGLKLDGENLAHIYVYGGFNTAIDPRFSTTRVPFLEAGGVYAIAHVRGGAELGENWHDQATGLNREKVYDDVAGAAKYLAQAGYTSARHLSLEGASNGGLVTGVAVTRNPELFDAAVAEVGLYDMVHYEQMGGQYWNQEYGTIGKENEATGLLSWSPYHNVKPGVKYPAVLVTTGKNDDRVNPAHSYKFAAALQDVETADHPVLLRVEDNLGHGHSATDAQWADRYADQWAFLLSELSDQDGAAA